MNSELSMEAAIKLVPQASKTSDGGPTFKDEDGDEDTSVGFFHIDVAINGYVLTISYNNQEIADEVYVVQNIEEAFELIRERT